MNFVQHGEPLPQLQPVLTEHIGSSLKCIKHRTQCIYPDSTSESRLDTLCNMDQALRYLSRENAIPDIDWTTLEPFKTPHQDRFLIFQTT